MGDENNRGGYNRMYEENVVATNTYNIPTTTNNKMLFSNRMTIELYKSYRNLRIYSIILFIISLFFEIICIFYYIILQFVFFTSSNNNNNNNNNSSKNNDIINNIIQ